MPKKKSHDDDQEAKSVDAELVVAPMRTVNLNLSRTKQYVKALLDMPAEDAMKILRDQVTVKLMLINEQVLKWLEILDGEMDWKKRMEASNYIEKLTKCAAEITTNKINLDKAMGANLLPLLPEGNEGPTAQEEKELTEDEFMKRYGEAAQNVGQIPSKLGEA